MQSSLKKSLYLGLAALSFVSVAAVSTNASAKSYATAGAYTKLTTDAATRNVEATGTNALYTKPGTVKGAKVVASKKVMGELATSKKSANYFRAYGQKTTNRGSVYYRVVTMDGKYRGYVYGGKTAGTFAGGVKSANTTTDATAPSKTQAYYLAKPGTTNTLWTAPKYTQYKASKVINSTEALANDIFYVDQAATKTREGSLYYHVTDQTNTKLSGWIYAKALQTTPSDSILASKGVTVTYIDQATGKTVKSGTVFTTKLGTVKAGANLSDTTGADQVADINSQIGTATPAGYTLTNSTVVSTGTKFGDTLTVTVTQNAVKPLTVSYNSFNASTNAGSVLADATTATTDTTSFGTDGTTTLKDANASFLQNYTMPSGTNPTATDLTAALKAAKLDTLYVPTASGATTYNKYTLNTNILPLTAQFGNADADTPSTAALYYTQASGTYQVSGGAMSEVPASTTTATK